MPLINGQFLFFWMKAVSWTKYGSPDKLTLQEMPKPEPGPNDLLIKIMATSVNRTDCAMLRAKPFIMRFFTGLFKPNLNSLGTEYSGVVEKAGDKTSGFNVGDKVFGFDDMGLNAHAQYASIPANRALQIPDSLSFEQAAVSFEGAHYAYNFVNKLNISSRSKVLVNGATGGIGTAIVQILKVKGASIVGTANSKNIELVKSLGAERVIDYEKEDITLDADHFDFVLDTVGKSSFGNCKHLLNPGGVYASSELGYLGQNLFYPIITRFSGAKGKKVVFPVPSDIGRTMKYIKDLIERGEYEPVVDRQYPLDEISEAVNYVEKGQKIGNVVITVNLES